MLVLVGHDERSFSLQVNITKDITSIVQWVKDFSISFPCVLLLYGILIAFSILVLTVNTQLANACLGLVVEAQERYVGCVQGWWSCIFMCICVCIYIYIYIYKYIYIYIFIYICMYRYQLLVFIVGFGCGWHLVCNFLQHKILTII